ncbi:alpha/beta fold hydrolase [Nonomuraea typhae]|uniref:alpha/beta fold hydrolase n=1 Tax=Nonomuraea typhae TaxID=2603600 RepID=UPI0012FCAE27|nr:alpha/beta hydrolase [Nonomuraea typhae]
MTAQRERWIESNGVRLWCETLGDPGDPAILLVMGLGAQGTAWPDDFCEMLRAGGRYVIRYDNRDTGLSERVDYAARPYTLTDLADDAAGLLDGLGVEAAHLVGASMGGMIAQEIALEHPGRVRTLTAVMSTAAALDPETSAFQGSERDPRLLAWDARQAADPPVTADEHIQARVDLARIVTGSLSPFDEPATRRIIARDVARAGDLAHTMRNHVLAVTASRDRSGLVGSIKAPALVIHGTEDPMAPFEQGRALAAAIPGSVFMPIEGMGHTLPAPALARIAAAILAHTGGADR